LTKKGLLIKDLQGFKGSFAGRPQHVILSGQDSAILSTQEANHSAGFGLCCLLNNGATMGDKSVETLGSKI